MKVIAVHSSNRPTGLTASLAQSVLAGAAAAGAETEIIHLCEHKISPCRMCPPGGWGQCRQEKDCIIEDDDFQAIRAKLHAADGIVFATPVYFWDISELGKIFLDRLRRAEWPRREASLLKGKPVIGIACAGGSGTGSPPAIVNVERYMTYLQLQHVVYLPVSRQNKDLQLKAAHAAGAFMVERFLTSPEATAPNATPTRLS